MLSYDIGQCRLWMIEHGVSWLMYPFAVGCLAPMASVTLVRTVSFSIYQKAKYTYSAAIGRATGEEPLVTVNRPGSIPTPGTILCFGTAGATAGGLVAIIACMCQCDDMFEATKLTRPKAHLN